MGDQQREKDGDGSIYNNRERGAPVCYQIYFTSSRPSSRQASSSMSPGVSRQMTLSHTREMFGAAAVLFPGAHPFAVAPAVGAEQRHASCRTSCCLAGGEHRLELVLLQHFRAHGRAAEAPRRQAPADRRGARTASAVSSADLALRRLSCPRRRRLPWPRCCRCRSSK